MKFRESFGRHSAAFAALLIYSLLSSNSARAGSGEDAVEKVQEQAEAASELLGERRFFVMPIPISNPTVGTGLGASATYLFDAGENAPTSSLNLMGLYTDTETWAVGLGTETYFKDDKYRLSGAVGYFDANLEFYGIGSGAGDRGESIGINQKGPFLVPRFLVQIAENLYLGPQFRYIAIDTALQDPILPPDFPEGVLPTAIENVSSGLGVVLERDSRDNKFFPHKGSHLLATTNFARDWIGSDNNYEQFELGYNLYRKLGEHSVLAWRATGCFREGNVPFYDLCNFGGEEDAIRGYVGGQYRDKVSVTTQIEYRWRSYKKWGMVAFGGIGQVAPEIGEMKFDDLLPSVGIGIRWMASEKERVNLSIDYARGKDSDAWYFRIGEAF